MSPQKPMIRRFDKTKDAAAVDRILLEVGWRSPSDPAERVAARERFRDVSEAFVAEIAGEAECYVSTMRGDYDYHGERLPFSGVTGVITSRVARKQGLASRTTARALAHCAESGSLLAGLGIFDQGFYDKLGFGTGAYEHFVELDPASLTVPYCRRTPVRLTLDDVPEMHAARLDRRRTHGSVSLFSAETTSFLAAQSAAGFGLGFRDDNGRLTHHLWVSTEKAGAGPYRVVWTAFETVAQYVELLGLLRNMGDQVYVVWTIEPAGVQLQDFVDRPFRRHRERRKGEFETTSRASASFQYRILDIPAAMGAAAAAASRRGSALPAFVMRVTDPVSRYLHEHDGWRGAGGDYEVSTDGARRLDGEAAAPDLVTSVGDFSRGWLGVIPFGTLRDTGRLEAGGDLVNALDRALAGRPPLTGWLY